MAIGLPEDRSHPRHEAPSNLTSFLFVEQPTCNGPDSTRLVSRTQEHPSLVPACHQVPERRPPGKMRWQLQLNSSLRPPNNLPPEPANLRCVQSCRSPITPSPSPTPTPPPPQQPARRLLCTNHKFYHRERLKNDRRGIKTSTSKRRRRSTAMPTISSSNPLKMSRQPFHN